MVHFNIFFKWFKKAQTISNKQLNYSFSSDGNIIFIYELKHQQKHRICYIDLISSEIFLDKNKKKKIGELKDPLQNIRKYLL